MTDNSKTYFGYPDSTGNAYDGIDTSIEVLKTLADLIGSCNDLHNLGDQMDGSLYGLSIIIDSARHGVEVASSEPAEKRETTIEDFLASKGLPYAAMGNCNMKRAWADGFRHRNHIINHGGEIDESNSDIPFKQWLDEEKSQEKPQKEPETKKRATAKQLQVREKLIAASYKEGHSVTDISQAINLRKNQIEKVLFRLARESDFALRPDEEKKLAANG